MDATVFRVTPEDGPTLRLAGELDMSTVQILRDALQSIPTEGKVTLELSELAFLDSSGLNEFAQYAASLNGRGPLILANVPERLASLLTLVAFDKLDTIEIR
jgi:anti-anti-sigma factor